MTTITLKIDKRTKAGQAFMAMAESFFKDADGIEIIENKVDEVQEERVEYNPEFEKMVLKSARSKNRTVIDPNDVWGSLGLK
ncbi:hypothetical protein FFWV33_08335 [Flavobacterium faecale]|uniref:Uncharacterized protein n=1 Tax=Flavobacterium faecale TaxID=1355330 RepID=A0A2S1LCV2_9FLAO|nr:hypothetical protein [Flavobacterium faecale]AWG21537.1 hypothetical protein FFWV33_08335 [Flavobacterium faecale]